MIVLLVLTVGRLINIGFEQPYILGNYLVRDVSDVISTFVYRVGLQAGRFAVGTAVGLFQSIVGLALLLAANRAAAQVGESHIW
jgi:putative aldouronate transport system permease protein